MNLLDDLQDYFYDKWRTVLPLVTLFLLVLGELAYVNVAVLPHWHARAALVAQLAEAEAALAAQSGTGQEEDTVAVAQMSGLQTRLTELAQGFLTEEQAANLLNRLYDYASLSQVEIEALEAQTPAAEQEATTYGMNAFVLEATGSTDALSRFVSRIKEASLPSVQLANLQVAEKEGISTLTMEVQVYTSPYSSGEALALLPEIIIPTATPQPTLAPVCNCAANVYDCRDFSSPSAAQSCYDYCGGPANDVHLLDGDLNGVACETVWP